jgi:hypothetical protein
MSSILLPFSDKKEKYRNHKFWTNLLRQPQIWTAQSYNTEVFRIKTEDKENHLHEIIHSYMDGNPTKLYEIPKSTTVFIYR